jgi:hypothetical protein
MTDKEQLLKNLVPPKDTVVLEDSYELASFKDQTSNPLSDIERLVVGDMSTRMTREEVMSKYGLTKAKLNTIMRKSESKKLLNDLSEEKHKMMKARLGGILEEGVEQYVELLKDKLDKGESVEKILFNLFGTNSAIEVYEKLGKMDKEDRNDGNAGFQAFLANITISKDV